MTKHLLKVNSEDSSLAGELGIYKTSVWSKIMQTTLEGRSTELDETKIQSFEEFFYSKESGLYTKAFSFFDQFQ